MPAQQQAFVRRVNRSSNEPKTTPNTPSNPKPARTTRSKSFHLPQPSGDPYSTSSIQDKVLKWQKLAAEESEEGQDKLESEDDITGATNVRPRRRRAKDDGPVALEADTVESRPIKTTKATDTAPVQANENIAIRTAPKKRVVSDEHWRRKDPARQQQRKQNESARDKDVAMLDQASPRKEVQAPIPKYDAWVRPRQTPKKVVRATEAGGHLKVNGPSSPTKGGDDGNKDENASLKPEVPKSDDGRTLAKSQVSSRSVHETRRSREYRKIQRPCPPNRKIHYDRHLRLSLRTLQ